MSRVTFLTGCFLLYGLLSRGLPYQIPEVEVHPYQTALVVQRNSRLVLDCSVSVYGHHGSLNFFWTKDGVDLAPQKRFSVARNGSLIFEKIINKRRKGRNITDAGFYECYGENDYGDFIGRRVHVSIAKQPLSLKPSEAKVLLGNVARFECKLNLTTEKLPTFLWEKSGTAVHTDSKRIVSTQGILQIYNVTAEDAGEYICRVFPHTGQNEDILERSAVLTVATDTDSASSDLLETSNNLSVRVGLPVLLECLADGQSTTTVTWQHKDGSSVKASSRVSVTGNRNIEITSAQPEDAGSYICTIRQGDEERVKPFFLTVLEPPKMTKAPESQKNPVAKRARLSCKADGFPAPTIHWYKNGIRIYPQSIAMIDGDWIIFGNFGDTDYYQCVAENSAGIAIATAWIEFTIKTTAPPPPEKVNATAISATSIRVTWTASKTPPCCPVVAYAIAFHAIGELDLKNEATSKTYKEIGQLRPFTNYSVSVRGFSEEGGGGHLSRDAIVQTLEAVPTAIPDLQITEDTVSSIRVTWSDIPEEHRHGIISQHELYYGTDEKTTVVPSLPGHTRSYLIIGLEPDTEYKVRVLAGNSAGYPDVPDNTWVTHRTPRVDTQVLPTPKLEFETINSSSVSVRWNADKFSRVSSYRITVQKLLESGPVREFNISANQSEFLITNLENNTFYQIDFIVKNSVHKAIGIVTELYQSLDPGQLPRPPPPRLLDPRPVSSSSISLKWSEPKTSLEIINYTVKYRPRDDELLQHVLYTTSDKTSAVLGELMPFTWYFIAVKAHTQRNASPYSKPVLVQTKEGIPSPPEILTAEVVSPGTVKLQWGPPKKQNGIITLYIIYYNSDKDQPEPVWQSIQQNASYTSVLVGDLTSQFYYFKLKACTNAGEGLSSSIIAIETYGCTQEPCPQCSASFSCQQDNESSEGEGNDNVLEQRLGIIIGCAVGLLCIVCCAIFVVVRHRQLKRMYHSQAQNHTATTTSSNGHVGRYLSESLTREESSDSGYSPILGRLKENENSDSKGGTVNGRGSSFCNGMKTALFQQGKPLSGVPVMSPEQRALLSPSSSSQGDSTTDTQSPGIQETPTIQQHALVNGSVQKSYSNGAPRTLSSSDQPDTDQPERGGNSVQCSIPIPVTDYHSCHSDSEPQVFLPNCGEVHV